MTTTPQTGNTPSPEPSSDAPKLQLSTRDMLVIFLALTVGCVTGLLTFASDVVLAQCVIAGLFAFGTSLLGFDRFIR